MKIKDFALERYFARWEFTAPYLLCASDVEGVGLTELLALADDELREAWETLTLGYSESMGGPRLRAEIAALYPGLSPDDVHVFTGAQEAVFAAVNTSVGPGDHVVVTWPGYQSLYEVARAAGADVTLLPLRFEDAWRFDLAALRAALRPNTRMVVVNFPHNPTGAALDEPTVRALAALADEAGFLLFSDEVYRGLEHGGRPTPPAAASLTPRAASLGVMSKVYGLAGLRIGWLATRDEALLRRCAAFKDYLTICPPAPSEVLATIALRAGARLVARSRDIIEPNLAILNDFFVRFAETFEWIPPSAGTVAFPRLRVGEVESFAERLVQAEGVLLLPGSVYGHGGAHFRVGLGRRNLPEGLARLERFLGTHLG